MAITLARGSDGLRGGGGGGTTTTTTGVRGQLISPRAPLTNFSRGTRFFKKHSRFSRRPFEVLSSRKLALHDIFHHFFYSGKGGA